jgi:hypothetical protein
MSKRPRFPGLVFLLTFAAGLPIAVGAQPRIENPARPTAKNAGRVVELEEVSRIRDDGAKVVFRMPHDLTLGADGALCFTDHAEAPVLYRFGPKGELVLKIMKKGQGPGEFLNVAGYLAASGGMRVLAWNPPKIMDFAPDGRYLREARVAEDTHGLWFLRQAEGKIYGIRDELFSSRTFNTSGSSPLFVVPNTVYEISADFKAWKRLYEFPVRMMMRRRSGFRLDPIDAVISGGTLYIVHTAEYRVTALDLRAGVVKHIVTRAYDRVRGKAGKPEEAGGDPETRGLEFPEDPYVWDIDRIQAAAGKLFVFTSTTRRGGDDRLVDVFDAAGKLIDSVFLRFPPGELNHHAVSRWTLLTDEGLFFVPEQDPDGLVSIGKYRIPDSALFPERTERR